MLIAAGIGVVVGIGLSLNLSPIAMQVVTLVGVSTLAIIEAVSWVAEESSFFPESNKDGR